MNGPTFGLHRIAEAFGCARDDHHSRRQHRPSGHSEAAGGRLPAGATGGIRRMEGFRGSAARDVARPADVSCQPLPGHPVALVSTRVVRRHHQAPPQSKGR